MQIYLPNIYTTYDFLIIIVTKFCPVAVLKIHLLEAKAIKMVLYPNRKSRRQYAYMVPEVEKSDRERQDVFKQKPNPIMYGATSLRKSSNPIYGKNIRLLRTLI